MAEKVTASITAENNFTDSITAQRTYSDQEGLGVSISGIVGSTVTIQRSFDHGANWLDVESFTANIETSLIEIIQGVIYRMGVKTGNFGSGTVVATLWRKV